MPAPADDAAVENEPGRPVRALNQRRFYGRVRAAEDADAFPGIATFYDEHEAGYQSVGFARKAFLVGKSTFEMLKSMLTQAGESLRRGAPEPEETTRITERAHRFAYLARDSVLRVARGPKHAKARRKLGFDVPLDRLSPEQLRAVIAAFLAGAPASKALLARAFVGPDFSKKLEQSLGELDEVIKTKLATKRARDGMTAEGAKAHEDLERFYDRFAAATNMAFADDEETRRQGLAHPPPAGPAPDAWRRSGRRRQRSRRRGYEPHAARQWLERRDKRRAVAGRRRIDVDRGSPQRLGNAPDERPEVPAGGAGRPSRPAAPPDAFWETPEALPIPHTLLPELTATPATRPAPRARTRTAGPARPPRVRVWRDEAGENRAVFSVSRGGRAGRLDATATPRRVLAVQRDERGRIAEP